MKKRSAVIVSGPILSILAVWLGCWVHHKLIVEPVDNWMEIPIVITTCFGALGGGFVMMYGFIEMD